ncbi:MAG: thermopsin family protease [Thermoplasmata archaeon]
MAPSRYASTLAILALLVLVLSTLVPALTAPAPSSPSHARPGSTAVSIASPKSGGVRPAAIGDRQGSGGSAPSSRPAQGATRALSSPPDSLDAKIQRQIADGQLAARDVFFPSSVRHSGSPASGPVAPGFSSPPAPMGLADFGIDSSGAYEYNTSSFESNLNLSGFSVFSPGYAAFEEAPDWSTFQLNTVTVNISYPGSTNGTFWAQNVVHFNGSELQFEDNIWNFSSLTASMNTSTLLSYNGTLVPGEFYYDFGPSIAIRPPFDLRLFNNITIVGGHPALFFNYSLSNLTRTESGSYDRILFNGTATVGHLPQFQVSGLAYDPAGLLNDAEFILGGDGGGSNANVVSFNGTVTLDAWNAGAGAYRSVRAAYDFGADTAETSLGVSVYYLGTTAYLNQGPSFLYGLWNTSDSVFAPAVAAGWIHVAVDTTPDYAFLFATFKDSSSSPTSNLSYVPSSANGDATTYLPLPPAGNPYVFWAWADGFLNRSVTVGNSSSATTLTLTASATEMDAPVYLIGDAQAAAFGEAAISQTAYSPSSHRLWLNASSADLAAPFRRLNDFDYPAFVLLATDRINTSVYVDGFAQASASFSYMVWTAAHGLLPVTIPGWTQGYYFFYGNGTFSVTDVTVQGNSTVDSLYPPTFPPGAVEFFGTHGSLANDVAASEDCGGVVAMDAHSVTLTNITATTGAAGVTILDSSTIIGGTIHASGADLLDGIASLAAYLYNTTTVTLSAISATNRAIGINASNGSGLTVDGLDVSTSAYGFIGENLTSLTMTAVSISESSTGIFLDNASVASLSGVTVATLSTGLVLNDTTRVQLTGLSVDLTSSAGAWTNSTQLTVDAVTVTGAFLLLNLDRSVTVAEVNSTVLYALAIELSNSTFVNVSGIDVANGAIGVALNSDRSVRLSGVEAFAGSVGAELSQVAGATIVNLSAVGESIGILWANGSDGAISWGNVSTGSLGAYVSNVTNLSIASFNGTEAALASAEFLNAANGSTFPTAVVATSNDTNVTVSDISSVEYPFAVWDSNSTLAQVDHVTAWNGGIGVAFNNTTESKIVNVFTFGGQVGVYLLNVSNSSLSASTLEDGVVDGLEVVNSTNLTVQGNNFVGNNGSSTNGVFSAAHLQATLLVSNSSVFAFAANYWSDHSSGAYVLTPYVKDSTPLSAALPYWLRLIEIGLPAHTSWGFTHFSVPYATTESVVYIPGWSLAAGTYRYIVGTTPGYVPSPASGAPTYSPLTNVTVTITFAKEFSVNFSETGLPSGTSWNVKLNLTTDTDVATATGGSVVFAELNGTYPYTVGGVPGYHLSGMPYTGSQPVAGAPVTKTLVWVVYTYNVTFTETGLPGGTKWSIQVNETLKSKAGASLVFALGNGTYPFTVPTVSGYDSNVTASSVVVNGAVESVSITFTVAASTSSGLPTSVYIAVGVVVVVALAGLVLLLRRRSRRSPPATRRRPNDDPFKPV